MKLANSATIAQAKFEVLNSIVLDKGGWTIEKLNAAMAILNSMLYSIATRAKAVEDGKNEKCFQLVGKNVRKISQIGYFTMAHTWLEGHARRFWGKTSRTTLRTVSAAMEQSGLFSRRSERPEGERKHRPSNYFDFDAEVLLHLYQLLESLYIDLYGWESLGVVEREDGTIVAHRGAFVRELFNAYFPTGFGFNRKGYTADEVNGKTDVDWVEVRRMEREIGKNVRISDLRRTIYTYQQLEEGDGMPFYTARSKLRSLGEWFIRSILGKPVDPMAEVDAIVGMCQEVLA